MKFSAPIDLRLVRRLFSRPDRIKASHFLRREIAMRMQEKLELVRIQPSGVLDAGCGEGADLVQLQDRFPSAFVTGIDASFEMLVQGRQERKDSAGAMGRILDKWLPNVWRSAGGADLACADFAHLPMAANSVDLVWSNLALHWHPQPDAVFTEWRRVLRTDGLLMFSCFGPDTLLELRQAFAQLDQLPHTLPFVDMHDFGDMLVNSGFSTPVMDMEKLTLTYTDIDKMLADVRALGGNPLLTRRMSMLGKQAYRHLRATIEASRNHEGKIPLTFEVIYGHAFRPVTTKLASGESIIRLDFPKK